MKKPPTLESFRHRLDGLDYVDGDIVQAWQADSYTKAISILRFSGGKLRDLSMMKRLLASALGLPPNAAFEEICLAWGRRAH